MNIYIQLIWAYFKIGLFGFGGGYAMLSLIQKEVVDSGWITNSVFTDIVAISQMTPGPIGINSATYIGYIVTHSVWGALVATISVVIPSYILVLTTSHFISKHKESNIIKGIFSGLRPIIVGLIASAALLLMNKENFIDLNWSVLIFLGSFILVYFKVLHPIFVIILAGIAGFLIY